MNFKIFLTVFALLFTGITLQAQVVTEEQVLSELKAKGLTEEEVSQELISRGYNINNIANLPPEELMKIKDIVENMASAKQNEKNTSKVAEATTLDDLKETHTIVDTTITNVEEVFEEEPKKIKEPVRIYGQELFRNKTIRVYQQSEEVKAPDHYILGPGDELGISIFGASSLDEQYTISKDGDIRIMSGRIRVFLKGLTFKDAKNKLYKRFREYNNFSEGQFAVTLNYSRAIQVSIYGEVVNQGPITIPAINTAFSALVAANGPNNLGSIRKIKLVKTTGDVKNIDVYKYINNPQEASNFYLDDGDIITVPVAQKVISIKGAISRPFLYELLEHEGLNEIIDYAGGLKENAFKKTIQVTRYEDDKYKIIDIPYADMIRKNGNTKLLNGDIIEIKTINENVKNYVELEGAFTNQGKFERTNGMRISDLINIAGIEEEAKTDQVFVQRLKTDGTTYYIPISIDEVLKDKNSNSNILLENKDQITLYTKDRYIDAAKFSVSGAVRKPAEYNFDISKRLRVSEAIDLSGGLRRDASNIAYLMRVDPLQPNETDYVSLDIEKITKDPNSVQNITLRPYDQLIIYGKNELYESSTISVSGAVNEPGQFTYGKGMTVKQALTLAKGLKLAASLNTVIVSRVVIKDNMPTKTTIANIEIDRDLNVISSDDSEFVLEPYDAIMVRYVPEFEMQEFVEIRGEVLYPGRYPIISNNEKISNIISRANGLTEEAYAAGATMIRKQDNIGAVIIKMEDILNNKKSKFNFTVRDGDIITIPKQLEFVRIKGATKVGEVLKDDAIGQENIINVPYHKGKSAKFYIDEYAGGIDEEVSSGKYVFVEHPNGEIKKSKWKFPFGRKYPEVQKGSTIIVSFEPIEIKEAKTENEDVDWGKILSDTAVQATTVLTLILLARSVE